MRIDPKKTVKESDELPLENKLQQNLSLVVVFCGVFVWFIKIVFL